MAEHGTSTHETAAIFNISVASTVRSWEKQLETQGKDALQSKKKGRPSVKKESNKQVPAEALQKHYKRVLINLKWKIST